MQEKSESKPVQYEAPKYIDILRLQRKQINKITFLKEWLLLCTTMDEQTIDSLELHEAYTHAIGFLVNEFEDPFITEELRASQFLDFSKDNTANNVQINGYLFNPSLLTVERAEKAERKCYKNDDESMLNLYLLTAMCVKGTIEGSKAIILADYSTETDMKVKELLVELANKGFATLNLWVDFEYISLVAGDIVVPIKDNFFLPK